MKIPRCLLSECNTELSLEEVDAGIGLCSRHLEQYNSKKYMALSCWFCCNVIGIYNKHNLVRGADIKDDFIFTKTCPKCSKDTKLDKLDYITISDTPARDPSHIAKTGKLVLNDLIPSK